MAKKYIDSEKLIAEIEKRIIEHRKSLKKDITSISEATLKGSLCAYKSIEHFIDSLQQEQPAETDEVKWHNDEDYDETDKGRFVLGSVGIGYNGYYIPYSDLLKLPKEE